jgi:hypothetical protein
LAAQLAKKPRDFGTDSRLVAALAAERVGAAQSGLGTLRLAVLAALSRWPETPLHQRGAHRKGPLAAPRLVDPNPHRRRPRAGRTRRFRPGCGGTPATSAGWPGNRKAYISHVWHRAREAARVGPQRDRVQMHAHRSAPRRQPGARQRRPQGQQLHQDLQDSAVVYKNAVFHFIRVDG